MFSAILAKLSAAVMSIAIGVSSLLGAPPQQNIGASIPNVVALFETSLASKITSSATTATLVSGTDSGGDDLSGLYGFIIDEGSSNEEFLLCTAAGTALTGCTRGVSVSNPTTTTASLAKEHRRGASVKITNYPQLAILSRISNGQASFPNLVYYNSAKDFSTASASVLVDKNYVDAGVLSGCANSDASTKGCVELSSQSELLAGTSIGGTGAPLVPPNTFYTASASANKIPVVAGSGFLDSSWINLLSTGGLQASGNNAFSIKTPAGSGLTVATDGIKLAASRSFGGTGTDGALSITSGSTSLDFAGAALVVKNYTSISITGTGALVATNPNSLGTILVLRSQGSCTITSTAGRALDFRLMGSAGGAGGTSGDRTGNVAGTNSYDYLDGVSHGGAIGGSVGVGGAGGAGIVTASSSYSSFSKNITLHKSINVVPGASGAGGQTTASGDDGGNGGRGGGAVILECAGAYNVSGKIDVSGQNGFAGVSGGAGGAGGGGGGAGGMILALYGSLTADSGTYTVDGGAGGAGGDGSTGANGGGGGGGAGSIVCAGGAGGNAAGAGNGVASVCGGAGGSGATGGSSSGDGGGGGGGAKGTVLRMLNSIFY